MSAWTFSISRNKNKLIETFPLLVRPSKLYQATNIMQKNRSNIAHDIKMANILYESHKEKDISERMAYVSVSSQCSLELNEL